MRNGRKCCRCSKGALRQRFGSGRFGITITTFGSPSNRGLRPSLTYIVIAIIIIAMFIVAIIMIAILVIVIKTILVIVRIAIMTINGIAIITINTTASQPVCQEFAYALLPWA